MYDILIGLLEVLSHHGEKQFEAFLPILEEFDIVRKIGAVTGDNLGTNNTLCRNLAIYLLAELKINWSASFWRTRCAGHVINLFVQAFLIADKEEEAWLQSYNEIESEEFENLLEEQQEEWQKEFEEQF